MALCSVDAEENAWDNRDNIAEWVVFEDDIPVTDLSALTRAVAKIGAYTIDSAVDGSSVIWWTDSVTGKTLPDGSSFTGDVVRVRLGRGSVIAGTYHDCQLITYDADNPNGATISGKITVTMHDSIA